MNWLCQKESCLAIHVHEKEKVFRVLDGNGPRKAIDRRVILKTYIACVHRCGI